MATGTTLTELLNMLRIELGSSSDPAIAQSERDILVGQLNRAQRWFYTDFAWTHLNVRSDKTLSAGQRYYDPPTDIDLNRIEVITTKWGGEWLDVERGIDDHLYDAIDSDNDSRLDPVQRWDVIDVGSGPQIEVWPVPASNGITLRFHGIKKLTTLLNGADKAILDDDLIVLQAAAKLLARFEAADAEEAANAVTRHYANLKGLATRRRTSNPNFAGKRNSPRQPRRIIAVHKET